MDKHGHITVANVFNKSEKTGLSVNISISNTNKLSCRTHVVYTDNERN